MMGLHRLLPGWGRANKTVSLCQGDGHLALAALSADGQLHTESTPIASRAEAAVLLTRWVEQQGLRRAPAVITLEPGSYSLMQMERPAVETGELAAAVRWRVRDLIDFPLDEAITDVFELPAHAQRGRTPMINVVVARAEALRAQVALAESAGLVPWKIDVAELALRNLAERQTQGNETVASLFLMPQRGMVQITRADSLYLTRVLEYGSEAVISAAREGGGGFGGPYDRVALELQRTMDYYDSHFGAAPVKRLIIMPPGEEMAVLAAGVGEGVGLPAGVLDVAGLFPRVAGQAALDAHALLALGGVLNEHTRARPDKGTQTEAASAEVGR
ncbi:pilus assembly protein PilM [Thioalkalivibrio sulfidiphilus]|uniref:pilus assembly protein PilM n=1 Tax=Thioalkalivibrio sulfidiphilus TaxID=1033854 RepID=UPI003BAEE6B6